MVDMPVGSTDVSYETIHVFDIPVARVTLAQAIRMVEDHIIYRRRLDIGVVNAAKVVAMKTDSQLRASVLGSDVIFADGQSVVWASGLLGKKLPERVAGIDLMFALLERGSSVGYRVYFLGAEEWVNARVVQIVKESYPGIQVAGRKNGYFSQDEEQSIAESVRDARADILFVAMTSPRKENFMARWGETMNATVTHGVGGSFDVFAGKIRRAPVWIQRLGFEWLFRVLQEPARLWRRYLVSNMKFLRMLARSTPPEP